MIDKGEELVYSINVGRTAILGGALAPSPPIRLIHRCRGAVMRICKIKDCNNKSRARGLCRKHYTRLLRYVDPTCTKKERKAKEKKIALSDFSLGELKINAYDVSVQLQQGRAILNKLNEAILQKKMEMSGEKIDEKIKQRTP